MGRDQDAGYGKPHRHSRFKKGQSGNPKGRPKGGRNFSTDVKATLEEPIRVTHHGKAQTVSTQHAALLGQAGKARVGGCRKRGEKEGRHQGGGEKQARHRRLWETEWQSGPVGRN